MSTIVHDLRTPMTNIYGFVDLMLDEDDAGTRKEYAEIINAQINTLTNMTTDVLDFAKGKTTILPRKYAVDKLVKEFARFFEDDIRKIPTISSGEANQLYSLPPASIMARS